MAWFLALALSSLALGEGGPPAEDPFRAGDRLAARGEYALALRA